MNKLSKKTLTLFFIFILAYFPTMQWMWERWFTQDSYYSHGWLIPLISILLIWQKRLVWKDLKPHPSSQGIWLFAAGVMLHLSSLLFRVYFTSGFSMIVVIAGFVLCVWGKDVWKTVMFPVMFLTFMIPLPLVLVVNTSFQLKMFSASMAAALLNVINIPAEQQGSFIRMSHATVVVEDVCSGLRSLIALLALGALFAYWLKSGKLKKTILFLSSIPVALVANTLRVMVLAIMAEFWGIKHVAGVAHDLSGYLVFILAFLFLSTIEKMLE